MRQLLLAVVATASAACGSLSEPPRALEEKAEIAAALALGTQAFGLPADGRIEAPRRPGVAVGRFAYGELPLVELEDAPAHRSHVSVSYERGTFRFDEVVIADLKIGASEGFVGAPGLVAGDVGIAAPAYERCPDDDVVSDARWLAVPVGGFTEASIEVDVGEGRFLWSECRSVVDRAARFRAPAIVPGFVYGFRMRARGKTANHADEELVVVAPPSGWAASSAPLGSRELRRGPLAVVRVSVDREAGASLVLRLAPEQLAAWEDLRLLQRAPRWVEVSSRLGDMLLFGIDVARVGDEVEATYTFGVDWVVDGAPFEPFLGAAERAAGRARD